MQADAGLIQNIGHAHQTGTDLGGQSDALGLASGQGSGSPGQGQIVQAHVDQEIDPGLDLF